MKSLYSTFVIFTLIVMFISGLLSFFLSNTYYQHILKQKNDEKYTEITMEIANYIEKEENFNLDSHLQFISDLGYQINLVDMKGNSSFYGAPFRETRLKENQVSGVLGGDVFHGIANYPKETFVTGFFANELENSIGVPVRYKGETYALFLRPDITLHFSEMRILFAWLLGLTIIFSLIFEIVLAKYLIQPLSKLNEATKKIRAGNFLLSFDIKRKDEIGELASSFQAMSNQLAQLDNMRNEFISNITHDIQSPLSNINGYTELLNSPDLTDKQKKEYVSIIKEESTRLSNLTSQLLLLSSLNQIKDFEGKEENVSISDQIKSLVRNYQWRLFEKEITLKYTLPDTKYEGEPAFLLSVWDNLLSNAIKYNKQGGSIVISISEEKEYINVNFRDTGIGLTLTQKGNMFDRFYRADTSRTNEISGTGLGLAIVGKIVALHQGEIRVESEEGIGTEITIKLPKQV